MNRWSLLASVVVALLWLLTSLIIDADARGMADSGVLYVAPGGDCGGAAPCYAAVQAAVDAAQPGDEIRVASGVYTDVVARPRRDILVTGMVRQIAHITKTLSLRGGYTTTDWLRYDPAANPTILDAQGQGRVVYAAGQVCCFLNQISTTIQGFHLVGGSAAGQGGYYADDDTGGGAFLWGVRAQLADNVVSGCAADYGGGLALRESDRYILTGNVITGNVAKWAGGGLLLDTGRASLAGNLIATNVASLTTGGGVFLGLGTYSFAGDVISGNVARRGGGLYLYQTKTSLSNAVVMNNEAITNGVFAGEGSGLFVNASTARLTHVTLAGNGGTLGEGLRVKSDDGRRGVVEITNTIVASQSVGVYPDAGTSATGNGILWFSTPVTITPGKGGMYAVTNQYAGDPVFGPDGYHLGAGSAAINKGVDAAQAYDIDGEPRFGLSDLGADEFWIPGSLRRVFLPVVMRN